MKKLFVLFTIVCAVSVMAESKTLWYCDFETGEGYQTGKVVGQCGWYKATGTITTRDVVAKEPGEAASGDQYLSYDPSVTDKGKITAVKFDISDEYVIAPYNQLRISWDQARISRDYRDDTCYVILHNSGETGRSSGIEIARFRLENNYASYTGTKADKSGQLNVTINMSNPDDWHHCCITLDPDNRMVKEFTVDDVVIDACTDTYYKNESDSTGSTTPRGGELIDGIGVMNKGKYDNFKVEMIPEPASLGLLALLGLFFVRKER
jgi:hypothetical protein